MGLFLIGQHWIGHGGTMCWPVRSPNLSYLDFYLWGHMKTLVYGASVDNTVELIARTAVTATEIQNIPGVFQNV